MHVESDPLLLPDHLYKCHLCEKKFKRKGEMKRHVLHVHEGKKYICKMCPLEFGWKNKLKEHILHVHEGVDRQRGCCPHCGKTLKKGYLNRHIQNIHKGETHKCDECNSEFSSSDNLKRHIESVHEGKRFKCEQCDYIAADKRYVIEHQDRKHPLYPGYKPDHMYKCDQCNKELRSKFSLRKHQYQHQYVHHKAGKQKKYPKVCPQCGKMLKDGHLRKHIRNVHEAVKYECDKCNSKFSSSGNLTRHKETVHDGIKRFECPQCVYVSAEKHLVEKHQKRKHPFDKSEMDILKTEISESQPKRYGFGDQFISSPGKMETKIFGNIIVKKQESIGKIVIKYSNNKENNRSFRYSKSEIIKKIGSIVIKHKK